MTGIKLFVALAVCGFISQHVTEGMKAKQKSFCCYYDQHYHNCYDGKQGCVLGPALEFVSEDQSGVKDQDSGVTEQQSSVQIIQCNAKPECPGVLNAGYFLRAWKYECPECPK